MAESNQTDVLLDTESAAALLNLSPDTLMTWRTESRRQGPPFIRITHKAIRYSTADLRHWIAERRIVPVARERAASIET